MVSGWCEDSSRYSSSYLSQVHLGRLRVRSATIAYHWTEQVVTGWTGSETGVVHKSCLEPLMFHAKQRQNIADYRRPLTRAPLQPKTPDVEGYSWAAHQTVLMRSNSITITSAFAFPVIRTWDNYSRNNCARNLRQIPSLSLSNSYR